MKTPPLKWLLFGACIAFIWVGVLMYYDLPEKPLLAVAAWVTSVLLLIVSVVVACNDYEE